MMRSLALVVVFAALVSARPLRDGSGAPMNCKDRIVNRYVNAFLTHTTTLSDVDSSDWEMCRASCAMYRSRYYAFEYGAGETGLCACFDVCYGFGDAISRGLLYVGRASSCVHEEEVVDVDLGDKASNTDSGCNEPAASSALNTSGDGTVNASSDR
jgi:hypothetical protein